jgi:hypothetical protein
MLALVLALFAFGFLAALFAFFLALVASFTFFAASLYLLGSGGLGLTLSLLVGVVVAAGTEAQSGNCQRNNNFLHDCVY